MAQIIPMVVDLSHWDPADDYEAVKADGIVGVIYKATEGVSYTDPTYVAQQQAAKACGLRWGSYHFADASSVRGQIDNYLRFASPDPDELFCLDWEDNPSGNGMMSVNDCKTWITEVERQLGREGQCVIYSGNTAKEQIDGADPFFGARRLWLAQYSSTPEWQRSWVSFWLWQFTDGEYGQTPHAIDGVGSCDINSYNDGTAERLIAEWATGSADRPPGPEPAPDQPVVNVLINAPPGVVVKTRVVQFGSPALRDRKREAGAED
jgi:lysozyme